MKAPSSTPGCESAARRSRNDDPDQSEWQFAELDSMGVMPRCEETGVNVDLHLVAYSDPETRDLTARILGQDFRHLMRRHTKLSVPISILNLSTLRQLESERKIPLGTRAAKSLREWFRHEVDQAWSRGLQTVPRDSAQGSLDLALDSPCEQEEEEPFQLQG